MSELAKTGVRAVKWSALSTAARFGLQMLAQVVLARTLGPENYGIFGIGMLVLTLSTFLTNFGFGWSLIRKLTLTDEDVRFAFTWQVCAGILAMSALLLTAPWLAEFFREPRVEPVIRWLSLACLFSAASAPASSLLQRDLNFRVVGLIQVGSYFMGYIVVGIPMALMGMGVSSLVVAWLIQTLVVLVVSFAMRPHPVKPLFHFGGAADAMGMGGMVFATNVVNWWLNNLDRLVIGRVLNVHSVGLYTVAYNLATMPNTLLLGALQPAFMAAGAQMQGDRQRLAAVYRQILATVLVLTMPVFVFLAVMSSTLVSAFYGAKWHATGSILSVLFLGMPVYVVWGVSTPVLWNQGRSHHEAMLQLPVLALGAAAFYWLTSSPTAAAWIAVVILLGRMLVVMASAFRALHLLLSDVLPDLVRGVFLSALCAASAWLVQQAVAPLNAPWISLIACSIAVTALASLLVRYVPGLIGPGALSMLLRFVPKLSRWIASGHTNG